MKGEKGDAQCTMSDAIHEEKMKRYKRRCLPTYVSYRWFPSFSFCLTVLISKLSSSVQWARPAVMIFRQLTSSPASSSIFAYSR